MQSLLATLLLADFGENVDLEEVSHAERAPHSRTGIICVTHHLARKPASLTTEETKGS